uniref:PilZ domain-containing protein n=1 Tax=Nitrospira cf. moscoviensis SBR1015 TaxID=96242 RepID=UPI0011239E7D|nr:PilZ domain-containing protein [Nitrospira cf. moscoviensis SBR1015]
MSGSIKSNEMEGMMVSRSYHRIYPRYPTQYPIIFGWASGVGEGLVTNLSFSGCTVRCGRRPHVGADVRVSILLPERTQALSIDGGTIKWVDGCRFGVEFQHLALDCRQRLNHILRKALIHRLKTHSSRPDQSNVPT